MSTSQAPRIVGLMCSGFLLLTWIIALVIVWTVSIYEPSHMMANVVVTYVLAWSLYFVVSKQPRSQLTKRFALSTGSMVFTVGLLELVAFVGLVDYRSFVPDPDNKRKPWLDPRHTLDPELLHILKPHQRIAGAKLAGDIAGATGLPGIGTYSYDIRVDHNGFRNDADLSHADIAVLGDSFIWAGIVPVEQTLCGRLANLQQCTVANLGQSYYGPQQELAALKRFAVPLKPKVCVWTFFDGNDLREARKYIKATADWGAYTKPLRSFRKRSFIRNAMVYANAMITPPVEVKKELYEISGTFVDTNGATQSMYFAYVGMPLSSKDLKTLSDIKGTFAEAYRQCKDNGIDMWFVFLPKKYRVYHDLIETDSRSEIRNWTVNDLPQRLKAMVNEISSDIGFIDLTPAFRKAAQQGQMLYYPDDTHWSPEGNALAADIIHAALSGDSQVDLASR